MAMPTDTGDDARGLPPWRNSSLPAERRVADLLSRMTLEEKLGQLSSVWLGADSGSADHDVAPHQHALTVPLDWDAQVAWGIGQVTRPFGTAPVEPEEGALALARTQTRIAAGNRFGIPAVAHEECLSGFTTWRATIYPTPPSWGASFDPALVERMAERIGASMRSVGVHQGLAPVLDVVRDPRWGRTEESIGEDPYLVGTVATAYVRGLQSSGVVATLKHFVGYSASRAGRNQAPVSAGPREVADVLLPPFEMALREGGARSVMHSYSDVDGVPAAADAELLTGLLRDTWGFEGTLVSDYFGVAFLETLHRTADSPGRAGAQALTAGVDVELPAVNAYGEPLLAAVRSGEVPEELVERAARRVLAQKCELGLLDPGWRPRPRPPALAASDGGDATDTGDPAPSLDLDLDQPESRSLAREMAEESVVLLANDGTLPLAADRSIAVVGPLGDDPAAMLGCYSFPSHVGGQHPGLPLGVDVPTVLEALRSELPGTRITHERGCGVDGGDGRDGHDGGDLSELRDALRAARDADVCVAVLGDRAGLFGRGTSGEGCDAEDLRLPGAQAGLLELLLATGTPVVLVLLTGRPYALGAFAGRLAAVVQAFFPGEEGGPAVAGVLSGRVCPSGKLPVSVPNGPGGQPSTYLAPPLAGRHEGSSVDPTALFPFGHGLSYTSFAWEDVAVEGDPLAVPTDGEVTVSLTVRNTGDRAGADVVQLYLHDPVAQVTRPVVRLVGYARVPLEPGERAQVRFTVHADLASFTGRAGRRVVEPGDLELRLSPSSAAVAHAVRVRLVGEERTVGYDRRLTSEVKVG